MGAQKYRLDLEFEHKKKRREFYDRLTPIGVCGRDLTDEEIRDNFYELAHRNGLDFKVTKFRGHENHVIFRQGPPDMKTSSK